jgi:hypothetical protein
MRFWRWAAIVAGLLVLVGAGLFWLAHIPLSSERLRRNIVASLGRTFQSKVELDAVELRLLPRFHVIGHGLVIRHRRHEEVPLIAVRQFTVASSLTSMFRSHVEDVVLDGLEIRLPPKDRDSDGGGAPEATRAPDTGTGTRLPDETETRTARMAREIVIDRLTADDSSLTILRRDPSRPPRVWSMHRLRMQSVGATRAMPFQTVLTNAVPPGEIDTQGTFGPWNAEDPSLTPIEGSFVFEQANLGVFNGLKGTLSARGEYRGPLERLDVMGRTTTPDFALTLGNHPIRLEADYHAVVDATNGNTALERVEATLGQTSLIAIGGVYEVPGQKGRRVSLTVTMDKGRLDDVLSLVIDAPKPVMTGGLAMNTALELPPGDRDVVDKLKLQGRFRISDGRFTDPDVQTRIDTLSGRAQPGDEKVAHVSSQFVGDFALGDGRLALQPVQFDIPGAIVNVIGQYGLRQGSLAFAGHVQMDASMSEAVGGWKGMILKPFNGLFRRDGRTFVPIVITGTRGSPKFGLDRGRLFHKDQTPVAPRPTPNQTRGSR